MKIEDVEGIGQVNGDKLRAAGVATTEDLLERAGSRKGRDELEAATGISHGKILEWANHVDLMRLNGVGSEYSDLLEAAGVDSPAELAQRNPTNLAQAIATYNDSHNIVRRVPTEAEIAGWIAEAKTLPKMVDH